MKRFSSVVLFAAECGLFYVWQFQALEAAGRILIFYLWVMAIAQLFLFLFSLIGAASLNFDTLPPKQGTVGRTWGWMMLVMRVAALVAIAHPALAGVYLIGNLLTRLVLALCRKEPAAGGA